MLANVRVGLGCTIQAECEVVRTWRIGEMNVKIANDDSRNNGDGCFHE